MINRTEGYTFADTIIGLAILSILMLMLFPSLRTWSRAGSELWNRSREMARLTSFAVKLDRDMSDINWEPWEAAPELSLNENGLSIILNNEETQTYIIEEQVGGIVLGYEESLHFFSLPGLTSFSILNDTGDYHKLHVKLNTRHAELLLPLRMGSCGIFRYAKD